MLFTGRLLVSNVLHTLECRSTFRSCAGIFYGDCNTALRIPGLGPSRTRSLTQQTGGPDGRAEEQPPAPDAATAAGTSTASAPSQPDSPAAPTASKPTPTPAASPLAPPPSSAEARSLADTLRQSSPTGRLIDLFAPQAGGGGAGAAAGRRPGPQAPGAAAPAAAADAAAAAAAAAADADAVRVVMRAVENCKPLMKIQQNKAGNKVLLVPKPLDPHQSTNFAVKWIVQAAQKRRDAGRGRVPMAECLAAELLLAYQRKGSARARRDEVHKLALDNRANVRARGF